MYMITYSESTVFNTPAQTIVNTINCVGVMGAGVALEFRLRYPEMFEDYVSRCKSMSVKIGRPYLFRDYSSPYILNFPTKKHWKQPSKIEWIEDGLKYFVANYEKTNISSIAFSQLGCGNGNLNWFDVRPVMEAYLDNINIPVYICLDNNHEACGIERKMVDLVNSFDQAIMVSKFSLPLSTASKITVRLPISRFREIALIDGVGKQTYERFFQKLYSKAQEQLVLQSSEDISSTNPLITQLPLSFFS